MQKKNYREIDLPSYTIHIDKQNYNIAQITSKKDNKKFMNKEFENEDISKLIFELISSRLASENMIHDLENERDTYKNSVFEKDEEIEDLLTKLSRVETFLEENRGKLE
ncbi:hypothetical protein K0O13_08220 [Mammaliicoccus sciuri]|uniref:hypothetical protein n=1 Tax=Mammaliicoccus sciuri TaxID=1296 RepID=UPI001C6379D7|nr:hypothetical protein [Mammaliicoccus sciuri]QYG30086.1 hypothetical protein K0O13_08220 [Mammaliicoccus sciuri]